MDFLLTVVLPQLQNQKRELAAAVLSGEAVKNMKLDLNDSWVSVSRVAVLSATVSRRSFSRVIGLMLWGGVRGVFSRGWCLSRLVDYLSLVFIIRRRGDGRYTSTPQHLDT